MPRGRLRSTSAEATEFQRAVTTTDDDQIHVRRMADLIGEVTAGHIGLDQFDACVAQHGSGSVQGLGTTPGAVVHQQERAAAWCDLAGQSLDVKGIFMKHKRRRL